MRPELRLDLSQLDAVTPHLDLMIDAAEKFQLAVRAPPPQISRAVEARTGPAGERRGDERLRRKVGACLVAARQVRTPDLDLARHSDR
jgi:hypothetical protein